MYASAQASEVDHHSRLDATGGRASALLVSGAGWRDGRAACGSACLARWHAVPAVPRAPRRAQRQRHGRRSLSG